MKLSEIFMRDENTREHFELTVDFNTEDQSVEVLSFELVKNGKVTDITELAQFTFDLDAIAENIDWSKKHRDIRQGEYDAQEEAETRRYFNARESRGLYH